MRRVLPLVTCDVMIRSKKGWLLGRRKNSPAQGEWYSIGGRLIKGEPLVVCARRKTHEETGLEVKNLQFVGVLEEVFEYENLHYVTILYVADALCDPVLPQTSDFSELAWFPQSIPSFHPFLLKRFEMVKA